MRLTVLFLACASCAFAEVHVMTLEQAIDRALQQNPDVILARLDAQRAVAQYGITNDPFSLKLGVGSGIAKTEGMPVSIDGNPPAVFQAKATRAIFDRSQNYLVAQTRENADGAAITVHQRQEEIVYQVTLAFLDAENAVRSAKAAQDQADSLEHARQLVEALVRDGHERKLELNRAHSKVSTAKLAVDQFQHAEQAAEIALAVDLAMPPGDLIQPALENRPALLLPDSQQEAVAKATQSSLEIRRLESDLRAKQFEERSYKAAWVPKINLVAQEAVLSKFNNYDKYYPVFQRNNFQIGVSIEWSILPGSAPRAAAAQVDVDLARIQKEMDRTRSRIAADIQRAYNDLGLAQKTRAVRREALDVATETVKDGLDLSEAGRAKAADVEASRAEEQSAWIQYWEAQHQLELAELNVQRTAGTIMANR